MRVFVSYTTKDPAITIEKLKLVENHLNTKSRVFIDKLHNINGGQLRVNYELCRSDIVLHLISNKYKSKWVDKELLVARRRKIIIVEITIDELLGRHNKYIF